MLIHFCLVMKTDMNVLCQLTAEGIFTREEKQSSEHNIDDGGFITKLFIS